MTGFYKLKLYFNTDEDNIKFHSEYMRNVILKFGAARSGLWQSQTQRQNPLTRTIMTPYTLDGILNKPSGRSVISNQKMNFESRGHFYEDNAAGSTSAKHKLVSSAHLQLSEEQRYEAMMGIDPEAKPGPAHVCH